LVSQNERPDAKLLRFE